jgi:plastocyanin
MWTNNDTAPHTATADNGEFDSGSLDKGGSFSFTFTKPGTYPYYCVFHGGPGGVGMASTIVVQP